MYEQQNLSQHLCHRPSDINTFKNCTPYLCNGYSLLPMNTFNYTFHLGHHVNYYINIMIIIYDFQNDYKV